MRQNIIYVLFVITIIIFITSRCYTKSTKQGLNKFKIESSCYLPNNRYNKVFNHKLLMYKESIEYVSELCLSTHRLFLFKESGTNLTIPVHVLDEVLSSTLQKANSQTVLYKNLKFTKKILTRFQRRILESSFYKAFRDHLPATIVLHVYTPLDLRYDVFDITGGSKTNIIYDNPFIRVLISIADSGTFILTTMPN